jgi:formylglycine-generating enzyme required for sulfatase activity/serine/threonine protein kinase
MQPHPRYEVFRENELGRNHYCVVFEAYDLNLKRDVVVMELLPKFRSDPGQRRVVWNQIEALFRARLENFVQLFDTVEEEGWIIVERLRGNMRQQLSEGSLSAKQARSVLQQVLIALKSLHEHDVVHGDVKPANILFNREGMVRLSFSPGLVMAGQIVRRDRDFQYLAPELLNPQFGEVGAPVDLYCLGFSVLELMMGDQFAGHFKGTGADAINPDTAWMQWHSSPTEVLKSVEVLLPELAERAGDLVIVLDRLLKKNVAERWQSADEALHELAKGPIVRFGAGAATESASAIPAKPPAPASRAAPAAPAVSPAKSAAARPAKPPPKGGAAKSNLKTMLLGGLVIVALVVFLLIPSGDSGDLQPVKLRSDPAGASLSLEGKQGEKQLPVEVGLPPGTYKATVTLSGYETLVQTFEIKVDEKPSEVVFKLVAKLRKPVLPEGLAPIGKEVDEATSLPVRATASRLDGEGQALEFVLFVPAEFEAGVAAAHEPLHAGEMRAARATLKGYFYLSRTEVSNQQYARFAADRGEQAAGGLWKARLGEPAEQSRISVVNVSWHQAGAFCNWIAKEGRLPDEVEWEFAARGAKGRLYPWAGESSLSPEVCNITFPSQSGARQLAPVDSLAAGATPEGLLHLLGNAAEWCRDLYVAGFDDEGAPGVGTRHTIRGGSFKSVAGPAVRLSMRANSDDAGEDDIGFRVLVPVADPAAR